ncbi:MAG: AmmeMemoRadiSam system protein B [Verrucomicrobiota bacterium]
MELPSKHHHTSYPEDPEKILQKFAGYLRRFPASSKLKTYEQADFLIVPHIDFRVNLSIYAQIYNLLIGRSRFPSTFVILGVGHRCPAEYSCCPFTFSTPLGEVSTHMGLWKELEESSAEPIAFYPETFEGEHSLEYVIVWLQVIRELFYPEQTFQVLPILMGGLHQHIHYGIIPSSKDPFTEFGTNLKEAVTRHINSPDEVCWIASIDGCHVGPRFQHSFSGNRVTQQAVKTWESHLWQVCESNLLSTFFSHLSSIDNMFYFDGVGVLTLLLQHFNLRAITDSYELWYQDYDQSFVSFTGGIMTRA